MTEHTKEHNAAVNAANTSFKHFAENENKLALIPIISPNEGEVVEVVDAPDAKLPS